MFGVVGCFDWRNMDVYCVCDIVVVGFCCCGCFIVIGGLFG